MQRARSHHFPFPLPASVTPPTQLQGRNMNRAIYFLLAQLGLTPETKLVCIMFEIYIYVVARSLSNMYRVDGVDVAQGTETKQQPPARHSRAR